MTERRNTGRAGGQHDLATVKDVVRRHWAGRAADFDVGPTHGLLTERQRAAWSERLVRWAGREPLDVLDVGCGTGFLALQLAQMGHRVIGIDVADEMLGGRGRKPEPAVWRPRS